MMRTQVVHHQMDGVGLRIAGYDLHQVIGNWGEERFGVGLVKCRPALGWTPQKTLAVPRRSYSESRRAIRPGRMGRGGRTSPCSTMGFSSMQTTGSLSDSGLSYKASTSSMRAMYSSFSSAMHQLFFPPRLQFVALKQDADCLPSHLRRQLPLHRFLCD